MHCTYSIEETKELSLSLYSDSMGVNKGKRPSLYSDRHGGVKVNSTERRDRLKINEKAGNLREAQIIVRTSAKFALEQGNSSVKLQQYQLELTRRNFSANFTHFVEEV